jgi:tetratricopeptide (TPR) repeat protein
MYKLLSKSKVLIVDDFANFRLSIKTMLERLGVKHIDQASNGIEAINSCTKESYDIIFCDYNLGDGQDGQQILEELHHRSLMRKGVLFLIVTAETTTAQVMGAVEYRPDAYLTKPFNSGQLGQRLQRLILKNATLNKIYSAINAGETNKAIALCDDVKLASPKTKFSCLRIKSELLEQQKDYAQLRLLYNEVIQEQPLLWAMLGLGQLYFNEGNVSEALEHFVEMRENFPKQVSILDWIAECHKVLGALEKAQETLKEAISISPKSVTRQANFGNVAASLHNYDIAQKAFAKTIHEGNYSCMSKAEHFEQYYDSTREVAKNMGRMDQIRLLAETDVVHKKMERAYQKDPSALATNLSSAATLFSLIGSPDKTSKILSKLSKTLDDPNCKVSGDQAKTIAQNIAIFADDKSNEKYLGQISSRLGEIQQEAKTQPQFVDAPVDKVTLSRKYNSDGMALVRQGKVQEALIKFREAIKTSPENMNYLLNASQIIIEKKELRVDSNKIQEAKKYLEELVSIDESDSRWKRYQKLLNLVSNV